MSTTRETAKEKLLAERRRCWMAGNALLEGCYALKPRHAKKVRRLLIRIGQIDTQLGELEAQHGHH